LLASGTRGGLASFGFLFEGITRVIINSMNRRYLALLTALAVMPLSSAKRLPPPNVKPVLSGGVEYSAHGDGTHAWVAATDVATHKELWTAKVFRIHTHWWKGEEDNQWVYISDLKLEPNALFIKDERERCYSLDLNTRHVKREHCR